MKRKYQIRHATLRVLHEKATQNAEHPDVEELEMSVEEIAEQTGYTLDEIKSQIDVLHLADEIDLNWRNQVLKILCVVKGSAALNDSKYLKQGRQEFWNEAYDVVKTASTIILVSIALATFIINVLSTHENAKQIEVINNRLDSAEATLDSLRAREGLH